MRYLILLILFFIPLKSLAADAWLSQYVTCSNNLSQCAAKANGLPHKLVIDQQNSPSCYNGPRYRCFTNSNPCDLPEVWNQETFSCDQPSCPEAGTDAGFVEWTGSPPSCTNNCEITKSGVDIGGSTPGSWLSNFTYTGAECSGSDNGDGGDNGEGGDSDDGGDPDNGGDNGGNSSGGSNSSEGGESSEGDDGGDNSGGDNGGDGSNSSGSNSSEGSGDSNASSGSASSGDGTSVSGGGNCDQPFQCDGDAIQCAILENGWKHRCNSDKEITGTDCDEEPHCDGDPIACANFLQLHRLRCLQDYDRQEELDAIAQEVGQYDSDGDGIIDYLIGEEEDVADHFTDVFNVSDPFNSSCPAPITETIAGKSMTFSWQPLCDFASSFRYLVIAVASFLSMMIIYRGVIS